MSTDEKTKPSAIEIVNQKMKRRRWCSAGRHFESDRKFYQDRFGKWASICRRCRASTAAKNKKYSTKPRPAAKKEERNWRETLIQIFVEHGAIASANAIPLGILLRGVRTLWSDDKLEIPHVKTALKRNFPKSFIVKGRSAGSYALAKDWEKIEQKKKSHDPWLPIILRIFETAIEPKSLGWTEIYEAVKPHKPTASGGNIRSRIQSYHREGKTYQGFVKRYKGRLPPPILAKPSPGRYSLRKEYQEILRAYQEGAIPDCPTNASEDAPDERTVQAGDTPDTFSR